MHLTPLCRARRRLTGPFSASSRFFSFIIGLVVATGTPLIAQTVTIVGALTKTYDGQPLTVSATTNPSGLPVQLRYLRTSGFVMSGPPVEVGSYTAVATVQDGSNATASAELRIFPAPVAVTVRGLHQVYDGRPKIVRVSVADGTPVWPDYDGAGVPLEAGAYPVQLVTDDSNVRASLPANLMMVVEAAPQAIAFDPLPAAITVGTPFSVRASANSGLPVTLTLVSGNATLSGTALTVNDTGPVVVRATQAGDRNHQPASETLTVSAAKQTQTISFGSLPDRMLSPTPITLTAGASSGLTVSYEIVGGPATVTGSTLTFSGYEGIVSVRARQAGDTTYNAAASVVRSFAVLTAQRPAITAQPVSRTVLTGGDANFSIGATAPGPLTYVWMKDGVPMGFSRPVGATYTVRNAQQWSEGSYSVAVFHGSSCVVTNPATLTVQIAPNPDAVPPTVASITPSQALRIGDWLQLTADSDAGFAAWYQWFKDGVAIPGAINRTYGGGLAIGSQNRFLARDAGTYHAVVRNSVGSVRTPDCTLTVAPGYDNGRPPLIADYTTSTWTTVGGTATLSVTALGEGLSYRWGKGGTVIAGATTSTLTIANAQPSHAGTYMVTVTNALGDMNSVFQMFVAVLNGVERGVPFSEMGSGDPDGPGGPTGIAPSIVVQPVGGGFEPGMRVVLSVTAEGTAPLTYEWRRDGATIPGATASTLVFPSIQTSDAAFYTVVVRNAFGSTEGWARVQVTPEPPSSPPRPPAITNPPTAQTVVEGGTAIFTVDVTGSQPLSFQWRKNGVPLSRGNEQTLTLREVTLADAGNYEVSVSNPIGGVTSPAVPLTVTPATPPPPPPAGAWQTQDIGGAAPAGNSTAVGGIVTIQAAGADIWDTSDAFHFRYQALVGDGTIVARVTGLAPTHSWAKAGVMIRESLAPGARNAMALVNSEFAVMLQHRSATNGTTALVSPAWVSAPRWLRLVRAGTTFTAYHSADGSNWILIGSVQLSLPATVYAGLAVTSHLNGTLTNATFDNVSFTGSTLPPPPPPPSTPMVAPSSLTATVMSTTAITLAWADNSTNETAFELQRSTDNVNFATILTLGANVTSVASTGLTPATTYHYRVRATRSGEASAFSNTVTATTQSPPSPPTPPAGTWQSLDIGGVAAAGSTSDASGSVTVVGSGADIWETSDEFHYRYAAWTGDGEIIARVTGLTNTHDWAKAGIMFRENLTPSSANAFMGMSAASGAVFQQRVTGGGSTSLNFGSGVNSLPRWLRLVRAGNTFTGYESADGVVWSQVGMATLALPSSLFVGLAVTSHNDGTLCTGRFDNVSLVGSGAPPSASLPAPGNLSATTSSSTAIALAWADNSSTETGFEIERSTNNATFVASGSVGANATAFTVTGLTASTTYYFRVRAVQGSAASLYSTTAVAVTAAAPPPSSGSWQSTDVGSVGAAGSTSETGGVVTLRASGEDIWNSSDEFHFRYQPLTGNGEIIARVTSLTNTHPWAKAGVMLRETLAGGARNVFMCITPGNGSWLQRRMVTGASTEFTNGSGSSALPRWLRLVRIGNTITGYESAGGTTWTPVGSITLDLAPTIFVGLALTSHNDGTLGTALFDNVTFTPGPTPPPPSTVVNAPTNLVATAISASQIEVTWVDNSDNETEFQLQRSTDNVAFTIMIPNRTGANTTRYSDTGLAAGTTYYYRVRALGANSVSSSFSNTGTATTHAAPPSSTAWSNADVGAVGITGATETGTNTITIRGSGHDIWDRSDAFRFLYRTLSADCVVEAQVTSLTNTHAWAKAGVMIRESLAPNARHVFLCLTPTNGIVLQQRQLVGDTTSLLHGPFATQSSYWVRLVRSGAQIVSYVSADGVVWSQLQAYTFPTGTALVGFAVTSHDNTQLATAVFTDPFVQ